jgi:hypothetical protein
MQEKRRLARAIVEARTKLDEALEDKRRWPREHFRRFFESVATYARATTGDEMIHRDVVPSVNGFRAYLAVQRKRLPADALFEADRLETIPFAGYDPVLDGDEPAGL